MQSILTRPAEKGEIDGFLSLARAIGEVPGVWGKDPRSDF